MGKTDNEILKAIDGGYYVVEIQLDANKEVSRKEYNKPEHFEISELQAERLARAILPSIEEFYSHEENRRKFEEWQKEQQEKLGE